MTSDVKMDARAYAQQGETFRLLGGIENSSEALKCFNSAIDQASNYFWAIAHRGATYRQLGKWDAALRDFQKAIEMSPDGYAWAYAQRGETYREMMIRQSSDPSIPEKAISDLSQAVTLDPGYAWAYAHLGATYYYLQDWNKSQENLTRAIELNASYAWAYAYRGLVYWKGLGDFDRAKDDWIMALIIDRNIFPNGSYQLGMLHHLKGHYDKAIAYHNQALKEDPDNYLALYGLALAKTYQNKNKQEKSQPEIDRTRAVLQTTCSVALYKLASLAILEDQHEQALQYLKQADLLKGEVLQTKSPIGGEFASLTTQDLTWLGLRDEQAQVLESLVKKV
jgi:tetratricopeptide (TPR) repeat protein